MKSALLMLFFLLIGCNSTVTQVSAVRFQFDEYERVALWSNLSRAEEDTLLPIYMQAFPRHSVVERRDLAAILGEQDLLPDRLNEGSRAKIREVLGVEAIVYPNFVGAAQGDTYQQLALKVIDSETGEISASVVVERTGDAWTLMERAIEALQDADRY